MNSTLELSWISETSLPCAIVRHGELGHLCGYVGVFPDHRLYGYGYSECTLPSAKPRGERGRDHEGDFRIDQLTHYYEKLITRRVCDEDYCDHTPGRSLEVHGGITYSNWGYDPIPRDGEWWFGFDCAHGFDLVPGIANGSLPGGVLRDEEYVRAECERLALQLARGKG